MKERVSFAFDKGIVIIIEKPLSFRRYPNYFPVLGEIIKFLEKGSEKK